MSASAKADVPAPARARLSPSAALPLALVPVAAILFLAPPVPIGPMFWDATIYADAAHRIAGGQVPAVDFFAPVGPLGYWLHAFTAALFPAAHPWLLASWSTLLVLLPLMVVVAMEAERRAPATAWALVGGFLLFALLPFNTVAFSSYPGADAFGIYNRQAAQALFVVAAALLFVRRQGVLGPLLGALMLALFLLKVTGFLAAGLLCALALLSGRVSVRVAVSASGVFAGGLVVLQFLNGAPLAYLADIATLLQRNGDGMARRLLQAGSVWFGTVAAAAVLATILLRRVPLSKGRAVFDHPAAWLGAGLAAGLFFESQNTGSQGFIHLLPIVLAFAPAIAPNGRVTAAAVAAALVVLPPAFAVVHQATRAFATAAMQRDASVAELGPLGRVTARPRVIERAALLRDALARHPDMHHALVAAGENIAFDQYAEADFQLLELLVAGEAVRAVRDLERSTQRRFDTVMALNFVNPYAVALDREAPRHVAIGADASRAVPDLDVDTARAVAGTDLVIRSRCPLTPANVALHDLYAPALQEHRRVELTPCVEAWIRPSATAGSP